MSTEFKKASGVESLQAGAQAAVEIRDGLNLLVQSIRLKALEFTAQRLEQYVAAVDELSKGLTSAAMNAAQDDETNGCQFPRPAAIRGLDCNEPERWLTGTVVRPVLDAFIVEVALWHDHVVRRVVQRCDIEWLRPATKQDGDV